MRSVQLILVMCCIFFDKTWAVPRGYPKGGPPAPPPRPQPPPGGGGGGGGGYSYPPPSGGGGFGNGGGGGGAPGAGSDIPIIKLESKVNIDGSYQYEYETGNGINAQESGFVKNADDPCNAVLTAEGSFSYTSPEGQAFLVTYTADENGFRPQGDHLPTPPPIPPEIQDALDKIAAGGGHPDDGGDNGCPQNNGCNGGGAPPPPSNGYLY
ncbi:PREDICTED: endocuticle structural glycoprotein SgAbd-8 [Rhagoletis zephyria]|uniref:endocuticle structural glycoprotein SgAbd-8 n=1 Tax=Rhagoletis zephyria TaxID=28612 RepID=UPI00081141DB|nr:PREDICTED: endocuticle structural glycoprotein SgAbd-8 [Rhagoletis zephyria]